MKKKNLGILIIMILAVSTLLSGCASQGKENTINDIKSKGKIVMGTSADYPPYEFHMLDNGVDTVVGLDIQLGKYIAEKLGVEFELKEMEFSNLLSGLSSGMLDIVIAGMANEPDRNANFSTPYDLSGGHLMLINKKNIDSLVSEKDFEGKTIGVQMGSIQKGMAEDIDGTTIKEMPALNTLVLELKTEKVDGVIMPSEAAKSYAAQNDDLDLAKEIQIFHGKGGPSVALKTGNDELTEFINQVIKELNEEGLIDKWKAEAEEQSKWAIE